VGNGVARPSREVDRGRHDLCGYAANPAFIAMLCHTCRCITDSHLGPTGSFASGLAAPGVHDGDDTGAKVSE
jgi:hypothetical protein